MQKRRSNRWLYGLGGLFVCMVLAALLFFYLDYTTNKAMPTIPLVRITETYPESPVAADQSVVVFGQASDPDGIAEVQLWINGQLIATQVNTDASVGQMFDVSQAWIPTGAANYLIILRAIDTKNNSGQSDPVMIEAAERAFTYEVAAGDTIQSIADKIGVTAEDIQLRNPSVGDAPAPGTALDVPPFSESNGDAGAGAPPEGEVPPRVDPPSAASPPTGEERPAELLAPDLWSFLPLPDNFICLIHPAYCATPLMDRPLAPPESVGVVLDESSCQILISWQDQSEEETGFRVYRVAHRPSHPIELIAMLQAVPGTGTRLSYLDESPPNQELFYFVAAYNASGESWSLPTEKITVSCRPSEPAAGMTLAVEALELSVRDPYDKLYCYASLAGSPFERVLGSHSSFLELEGAGFWNIAEHFSGDNKRTILNVDMIPVDIVVECLGWGGGNLINLGRFHNSHPAEEWDGRPLRGSPPDGSYTVTYHIQYAREVEDEAGRREFRLVDMSYPSPFDLRAIDYWQRCNDPLGSGVVCDTVDEPGLEWDYPLEAGRIPEFFRVYLRRDGEEVPRLYFESFRGFMFAPQSTDCNTPAFYSVSAVVGMDSATGELIESFPSAELEVPVSCAEVEITLTSLWPYTAQDHISCNVFQCVYWTQAYGWLQFNGQRIRWNINCDGINLRGGNCSRIPHTTSIQEHTTRVYWENEYLNTGAGWAQNNNVFRIPVQDGLGLRVKFSFSDHDDNDGDDFWCGTSSGRAYAQVLEPRSLEELRAVDQDFALADDLLGSSIKNCEIYFHVRGLP